MNIVQLLAHSIEEHDQLRLWHSMGHNVFSIGGYIDPAHPHDDKRPPMPEVPLHADLKAAVDALGQPHARVDAHEAQVPTGVNVGLCADGHSDPMEAARRWIPDAVLDWMDVLIVHHLEHTWVVPQWDRLKKHRVIWRTVGQSAHMNEAMMAPLRRTGLEIVRYSPKERNLPNYAGEDALIRFYKDPEEWKGWNGDAPVVTNITQSLFQRSLDDQQQLQPKGFQWTSYTFWNDATLGLSRMAAGPGSEAIDGTGSLSVPEMHRLLQDSRCYLYTGTQPASYTLGFIEAGMTGIPLVSIGAQWHRIMPYGPSLFEGHELAPFAADDPAHAKRMLQRLLDDHDLAKAVAQDQRARFIRLFGMDAISAQWDAYLAGRVPQAASERVAVAA